MGTQHTLQVVHEYSDHMKVMQNDLPSASSSRRGFLKRSAFLSAGAVAMSAASSRRVWGANERLGIGVIGTGGRAGAHLGAIEKLSPEMNTELVALCDVYRPRLEKTAARYQVKNLYMDHKELLEDARVDVVSIATPDHTHGLQALDAVLAGKDVYCEKPVTHWTQFELTKKLAKAVKETGRVFQLGTQGMSDGAWHLMRKLVKEGMIGQPIHAECGYFRVGDWGERGMPIDDPNAKPGSDLSWDRFLGESPKTDFDVSRFFRWRMYKDYAGGPATDLFPHSLTPVMHILDLGMPSEVVAVGGMLRYQEREVPDTYNMLAHYPEKVTIAVLGTQGNSYSGTGARGAGQRIPVVRGWEGALTVVGENVVFTPIEGESRRFAIDHGESFQEFYQAFIRCCHERNPETLSPMHLAYRVQTALQMGMFALLESKVARFDVEKEKIVL